MVLPQAMAWVQYWFRVLSLKFCGKSKKICGDISPQSPAFCMYASTLYHHNSKFTQTGLEVSKKTSLWSIWILRWSWWYQHCSKCNQWFCCWKCPVENYFRATRSARTHLQRFLNQLLWWVLRKVTYCLSTYLLVLVLLVDNKKYFEGNN